jgi:hypothetical protein
MWDREPTIRSRELGERLRQVMDQVGLSGQRQRRCLCPGRPPHDQVLVLDSKNPTAQPWPSQPPPGEPYSPPPADPAAFWMQNAFIWGSIAAFCIQNTRVGPRGFRR